MDDMETIKLYNAARDLKQQCEKLEKLSHRLNTTVSASLGRVDLRAACSIMNDIEELKTNITTNLIKFM